jgi:hypothetical protein
MTLPPHGFRVRAPLSPTCDPGWDDPFQHKHDATGPGLVRTSENAVNRKVIHEGHSLGQVSLDLLLNRGYISPEHRLGALDPEDPMAFEAVHEGEVISIAFGRGPQGEGTGRLRIGLNTLYKRPKARSLRFRTAAGLGVTAGTALAVATRSTLKEAQKSASNR